MSPEDLSKTLELHRKWHLGEPGGVRANLRSADLTGADLAGADLAGADLTGADLTDADLAGATLPRFQIVPETGAFTAWKKVYDKAGRDVILKLEILSSAERVSTPVGRKCRASKIRVLEAWRDKKCLTSKTSVYYSQWDSKFTYHVGRIKLVKDFDPDIRVECTRGIHFFITRAEAEEYCG